MFVDLSGREGASHFLLKCRLSSEQRTVLVNFLHHHNFRRDIRTLLFGDSQKDQARNILLSKAIQTGPPREILQGGTRLLWGLADRTRLLSKLRILGPIKPLVKFHKYIISCAAECPDNIYFTQSSDKHNSEVKVNFTLSLFYIN